jgi:hypothetical protein
MKGQLSLELLLIVLSSLVAFSLMLPVIEKVSEAGKHSLVLSNIAAILDKVYYSCERVKLLGETEEVILFSMSNYSLKNISSELVIFFQDGNRSVSDFDCLIDANISVGQSHIFLNPSP